MNQLSLFDFPPLVPVPATGNQGFKNEFPLPANLIKNLPITKPSEKPLSQVYAEVLADYIPGESLEDICNMLAKHKVFVKITRKRHTKLGDYRSPHNGTGHKITINHDLNKYSFLVTLIHEIAHLTTFEKHKRSALCERPHTTERRVKPHGAEWKNEFREGMLPFLKKKIFPEEIVVALNRYLLNPAASSCTDTHLLRTLRKFDKKNEIEKTVHLEDIPENTIFILAGNSKIFRKGKKLRKRFLCSEIKSKRKYLVSPVAEVIIY